MSNFDSIFNREFRDMMNGRKSLNKAFNLVELPIPELTTMRVGPLTRALVLIKGVKEPFFDRLNNLEVELIPRTTLQKRKVMSDGKFRKDNEGKFVCIQVPVPMNCVAILTNKSIGLKNFVVENGVKKRHKVSEGFKYVDYRETKEGRKYIYIVPKSFVYRLNASALVIALNPHKAYYKGCKLALQNGNYVYLYVIPYKYRTNATYRVLGVKTGVSFDNEVKAILRYWSNIGVIFNPNLTKLEDNIKGLTNLGIMNLLGTCSIADYERYSVSLVDERVDTELSIVEEGRD